MLDARPSLQPIRWTALSEPAEPLLVQPVERQGLANEPLKGQVDGLGAFEDGTLDLGRQEGEGCSGSDESVVMACGSGDFLKGSTRLDRAGPAMRFRKRIPEDGIGFEDRGPGDKLHLDPASPQADRDGERQYLQCEAVRCNAEPMRERVGVQVQGQGSISHCPCVQQRA